MLAGDGVYFEDFSTSGGLVLNGSTTTVATTDGDVLRLTPALSGRNGSAFSESQVNASDFSTAFTFRITSPGGDIFDCNTTTGADGFVFVVQSVSSSIGGIGSGIGYEGIVDSVGVEFDTWCNAANWDPSSNHIGIVTEGSVNHGSSAEFTAVVTPDFDDGNLWYAWVDYDGETLEVRANQTGERPAEALLTRDLDVPAIIENNTAYVGFTSATGAAWGNHDIISWQYNSNFSPIGLVDSIIVTSPGSALQGTEQSATATVLDRFGDPVEGMPIEFEVTGANPMTVGAVTDANGQATITYTGNNIGQDTIVATADSVSNTPTVLDWLPRPDLVVSSVNTPTTWQVGFNDISWTVTNVGDGTASTFWYDRVVLSTDMQYDIQDRIVASESAFHQLPLASLESYEVQYRHILSSSVAAGNYYLLYIADFGEQALEADETNNVFIQPIEVVKPDLVVETATATSPALFGNDVSVSWTVRNVGTVETDDYISQAVWLSTDETLNYGDIELERFPQEAGLPLAPGEGYTTTVNVPLPLSQTIRPGTYYLIVETDSANGHQEIDETNNTLATLPISISYPPLPDLIVSDISAPLEAISGQSIPISWTVTNQGDGDFQGTFRDWVALSDDDTYGSDLFYQGFDFTGVIPAGQSITRTQLIDLPDTFTGEDLRVIVYTDGWNQVLEIDAEDNNVLVADNYLDVILAAFPNLVVDEVIVPPLASSEQEIVVEWIVSNAGTGPTNATYWDDQVYLSTDPFWDPGDYRLGTSRNPSYLQAGDSYRASLTATLPRGIDGDYYVIVLTDAFNRVWEHGNENDNENSSTSFEVQLTPPPDLQVTSVQAPTSAFSGQEVQVSWTVSNEGANATNHSRWRDRIYVSSDSTLSGDDVLLTTVTHDGVLAPGENYTATGFGDLPIGVSGDFFFLVETDAFDSVYEHQFENNNVAAETQATNVVLTPPPDLEVVSVVAPLTISANRQFAVSYRVENNGSTPTPNGSWTDRVYLSDDFNFDPSGDVLLDSRRHYGTLAPGEGYDFEYVGILDEDFVGDQHFYVVTDYADDVFELDNLNNLASADSPSEVIFEPGDLTVSFFSAPTQAEAGDAFLLDWSVVNSSQWDTASQFWYDRVVLSTDMTVSGDDIALTSPSHAGLLQPGESYRVNDRQVRLPTNLLPGSYYLLLTTDAGESVPELDETNNASAAMPLEVSRIASDLRITSVSATDDPQAGGPITVQWTVRNFAPVATNSNIWFDEVYLSTDYQVDSSDTLLASVQRGNPLGPNEEYSVTRAVTLPEDLSGRFFILVRTDATDLVIEGAYENNNLRVTSGEIPEGIDPSEDPVDPNDPDPPTPPEGNIQVVTLDPPDLSVVNVDAPANALSGQDLALSWTVQNIGQGDADGPWYDSVYLSLDQVFDRSSDIYLGYADRPGELAAGESYTQNESFEIPAGFAGPYYVFVIANANGRVNERGKVFNNPGYDPLSMQIDLTSPADFVVGTINVPTSGTPGAEVTVSYTVENQGSNPAFGYWTDSIYLSADETWDIDDPLLGRVRPNLGTLAVGASYNESLTAQLPGVVPGSYHIIIRSDILNHVPEADENNNIGASLDQADVTFPELELGVAAEGTLEAGQNIYYRVTVPAGETLSFELDSDAVDGANEIYVAYNRVPTRSDFDFTGSEPFSVDQRVTVPETESGTYYILLRSANPLAVSDDYSLSAQLLPFSINTASATSIGNGNSVTFVVTGSRLTTGTAFTLTDSEGVTFTPTFVVQRDLTSFRLTFDLLQAALGPAILTASEDSGAVSSLANTIEIVDSFKPPVEISLEGPTTARRNQAVAYNVSIKNPGNTDTEEFTLWIKIPGNTRYRFRTEHAFASDSFLTAFPTSQQFQEVVDSPFTYHAFSLSRIAPGGSISIPIDIVTPDSDELEIYVQLLPSNLFENSNSSFIDTPATPAPTDPFFASQLELQVVRNTEALSSQQQAPWDEANGPPPAGYVVFRYGSKYGHFGISLGNGYIADSYPGSRGRIVPLSDWKRHEGQISTDQYYLGAYMPTGWTAERGADVANDLRRDFSDQYWKYGDFDGDGKRDQQLITDVDGDGKNNPGSIEYWEHGPLDFLNGDVFDTHGENGRYSCSGIEQYLENHGMDVDPRSTVFNQPGEQYEAISGKEWPTRVKGSNGSFSVYWPGRFLNGVEDFFDQAGDFLGSLLSDGKTILTNIVRSLDPNDILGPEGFGPENFIAATEPLDYTIRFENDPIFATAPAQTVRITQQLDADLDFRSFRLGDFGIGTQVFEVPDNRAFYVDRLDLTAELGILVDVFAGIDVASGQAFWEFTSIDPATGDAPTDALAGFLPPNLMSPEGEGFVTYSIKASPDAVTGDIIDAEARIIFDTNEPIDTPPIFHTLDVDAPTSSVEALPLTLDNSKFELSWSGQDGPGGSGVAMFDIYVSEDGGAYQPFVVGTTLTAAPFIGKPGKQYEFFSVAHDYAGNIEATPGVADGVTTITEGVATLGDEEILVSLTRTDETSPVGTSLDESPSANVVFHEWESIVAQIWVTIIPEMAGGPVSLEAVIAWENELFLSPEVLEHLGSNLDISSHDGITKIWWDNVELSGYQAGQRVLIANLLFPVDRQNGVGISSNVVGEYPTVTQQDAFQLSDGKLGKDGQVLNSYPHIDVPIAPVVYDSDDSGHVGIGDFAQFIRNYGRTADLDKYPEAFRFDFNRDGRVGIADFAKFIQHYGQRKDSDNVTIRMPELIPETSANDNPLVLESEPPTAEALFKDVEVLPSGTIHFNFQSGGSDLRFDDIEDFKHAPHYWASIPSAQSNNNPDPRLIDALFETLEPEYSTSKEEDTLMEIDASLLSDLADELSKEGFSI
ncbi:hypothetical protein Pan97_38780 [Bremerella volcania]|uniref:Big-1 domain-containing protein n=1 Tax=Bremerella volcania TaxID=2527984 RepID=A0A518CC77_9BACT|nr:CARDB domain-containing protein [Bremerella volcania]QDU76821.1 hypothetical protein Pan97_38780 [Bremerella volcania]